MSLARVLRVAALASAALVFAACGSGDSKGASSTPASSAQPAEADEAEREEAHEEHGSDDSAAVAEAKQIFGSRCFTCHGAEGAGDGPGSAALNPKPRDFRDAAWQDSVSDDHIANIVKFGGAAVGKSPTMPGNPDLMSKPEVVAALVAHVRSLRAAP